MLHRRNRFFGKNSDAKIGCVVSAGRRLRDTPTVAGLRRRRLQPARRKGPQYFKPDCGVSQGGGCGALHATMIICLRPHMAGLRPAGSHCENSGSSDGTGASARSDRAKSEVFRDRSASAGVVTRYFSPCLIFWCFWIKPKARKKENVQQKKSILREEFRREDRLRRICGSEPAEARRWGRAPQCCGG